jgi:hypothetical protein
MPRERRALAAPDCGKRQPQRNQQEMAADGLREQSTAWPRVTAVLDAVEKVGGDERCDARRGGERTETHEPRRREETQWQ